MTKIELAKYAKHSDRTNSNQTISILIEFEVSSLLFTEKFASQF